MRIKVWAYAHYLNHFRQEIPQFSILHSPFSILHSHDSAINTNLYDKTTARNFPGGSYYLVRFLLFFAFFCWLSQVFITMEWGSSFTSRTCIRTEKP